MLIVLLLYLHFNLLNYKLIMKTKSTLAFVLFIVFSQLVIGQKVIDSTQIKKEYSNLNEALKNPEKVYRLNLSNQNLMIPKDAWPKFVNLEFLSFRNDHLKEIPSEIGILKNLKIQLLHFHKFYYSASKAF